MIRRLLSLVVWLVVVDVACGVVYDGRMVSGEWRTCIAAPQHPTKYAAGACGELAKAGVTQGIPWASQAIVNEARVVWRNSREGKNTI